MLHVVLCAALDCTGLAGMIWRRTFFVCVPFCCDKRPALFASSLSMRATISAGSHLGFS